MEAPDSRMSHYTQFPKPNKSNNYLIKKPNLNTYSLSRPLSTNKVIIESKTRRLDSLTIADVSPKQALQHLLGLIDTNKFNEASALIRRLSLSTFRHLAPHIPLEQLTQNLPRTANLVEAVFAKNSLDENELNNENVLFQIINHLGTDNCDYSLSSNRRLIMLLIESEPRLKRIVEHRLQSLNRVIEGLGQHGFVGNSAKGLLTLEEALRHQLMMLQNRIQDLLHLLKPYNGNSGNHKSSNKRRGSNSIPVGQSHQRQLSLRLEDIQNRLVRNKRHLGCIENALKTSAAARTLETLIDVLRQRIRLDNELVMVVNQIDGRLANKLGNNVGNKLGNNFGNKFCNVLAGNKELRGTACVTPMLLRARNGCRRALELMESSSLCSSSKELHSNSSLATMAKSGYRSSATIRHEPQHQRLKAALSVDNLRDNFDYNNSNFEPYDKTDTNNAKSLNNGSNDEYNESHEDEETRPSSSGISSSSTEGSGVVQSHISKTVVHVESDGSAVITAPLLDSVVATKYYFFDNEARARGGHVQLQADQSGVPRVNSEYDVFKGDRRPAALVRDFADLYALSRLETMDALDELQGLGQANELKNKLIFSVMVLSFRSAWSTRQRLMEEAQRLFQMSESDEDLELESAIRLYLRRVCHKFQLQSNFQEVCDQIWSTLYDYPELRNSQPLLDFVQKCLRLSWGLVNQTPSYRLEYETRVFRPDLHVAFRSRHRNVAFSNSDNSNVDNNEDNEENVCIKTYLWPALIEGDDGPCVQRGVVVL